MAFQYSIAFYEQGSFIKLVDGVPSAGVVSSLTFDYYVYRLDSGIGSE